MTNLRWKRDPIEASRAPPGVKKCRSATVITPR
jgi:hypothetical protein